MLAKWLGWRYIKGVPGRDGGGPLVSAHWIGPLGNRSDQPPNPAECDADAIYLMRELAQAGIPTQLVFGPDGKDTVTIFGDPTMTMSCLDNPSWREELTHAAALLIERISADAGRET